MIKFQTMISVDPTKIRVLTVAYASLQASSQASMEETDI